MSCPQLTDMKGEDYSRWLAKLESKRIPGLASFELTPECNLRCVHCYVQKNKEDGSLSTDQVNIVLDRIASSGCLWLLLTGGEPLTRPDFGDLYDSAINRGFLLTVFTNGTLITPDLADRFAAKPPHKIEITLYGATSKTYEAITGIPGSFEKCVTGINLLVKRNVPLSLKAIVMKPNRHELPAMENFAEKLGLKFRIDPLLHPKLDGSRLPYQYRLDIKDVVEVDMMSIERAKAWSMFWKKYRLKNSEYLYTCGAGKSTFHVDYTGKLSVCLMNRLPSYDLLNGSFNEVWTKIIPGIISQKRSKQDKCRFCDYIAVCNQCPGWSILEHNDQNTPVEYLCQLTKSRAEVFESGFTRIGT